MSSGANLLLGRRERPSRRLALQRAAEHGVFGLVPLVVSIVLLAFQFRLHAVAPDFHVAYWPAVHRLLHGLGPYAATHRQIIGGRAFVYPALSAVLLAPFGLIGRGVAEVIYTVLCIACIPATLRTLKVQDWRVYGIAMLWFPLFNGWQSGNLTLPLMLVAALIWRNRDRPVVAGLLTVAAVSAKPFVWPLALWLLATRRWKAAAWALVGGLALNLVAWGLVGFNEFSRFLHISSEDTHALWREGYGLLAVGHHLGMGLTAGTVFSVAASGLAAGAVIYAGVVRRSSRDAFVFAVVLALLASPLLWAHYFSLLLLPLALCRPRLSFGWALPILMWPLPPRQPVHGWEELIAWGVLLAVVALCLRAPRAARAPRPAAPVPAA